VSVLKRKISEAAAKDGHVSDDDVSYLHQQYRTSKRSLNNSNKNYRLPRVELAARFEKDILDLWDMKKSHVFRFPVPKDVAGYYDVISNPMCLMDIREKIAEYKYLTAKSLLDDVTLIAENAEKFNGVNSEIAKYGLKLVARLKNNLSHEFIHFGPEGDTVRILEEAIQKKLV